MTQNYSVKKLDRRHVGGDYFRYRVEINDRLINPDKTDMYRQMLEWCRSIRGPSSEVRHDRIFQVNHLTYNQHWCFDNEWFTSYHIYLTGDKELVIFELRWPVDR